MFLAASGTDVRSQCDVSAVGDCFRWTVLQRRTEWLYKSTFTFTLPLPTQMVTHQLQASESSPVRDRRSTTELHH